MIIGGDNENDEDGDDDCNHFEILQVNPLKR